MIAPVEHLSYSSISTYINCGRQWKYKYMEKLPDPTSIEAAFGTAFHRTIQEIIRIRARTTVLAEPTTAEIWNPALDGAVFAMGLAPDDPVVSELRAQGLAMLEQPEVDSFLRSVEPLVLRDEAVMEQRITLRVSGVPVPIIGYIDLVQSNGIPIDFKTSSMAWPENRAKNELQTLFYLAALRQEYRPSPGNMFQHVIFPKSGKKAIQVFEHAHTEQEIEWLFEAIREYWHGIESGVFPPTSPSNYLCNPKWCSFWKACKGD